LDVVKNKKTKQKIELGWEKEVGGEYFRTIRRDFNWGMP
jgi:hypothetical protein